MLCGGINQGSNDNESANKAIQLAIEKHNAENNDKLEFQKIVELSQQVVAGVRFRATIECLKAGATVQYFIDIWCKPGPDYPTNFQVEKFEQK